MRNNHGLVLIVSIFMIISMAAATQYKVGGSNGWTVPDPNAISYNQWAEKNRFQIGDSLLFVYLPDKDSVLLVDVNAYNSCDSSAFVDQFNDGNTVFTFTHSGPFYFISGIKENCQKNEKLHVIVLSDRSNSSTLAPSSPTVVSSPPPPSAAASSPPPPLRNGASYNIAGLISVLGSLFGTIGYICF